MPDTDEGCQSNDDRMRAELRAVTEADATTTEGRCDRWQKLAAWVHRFRLWREGPGVIDFSTLVRASRMFPNSAVRLEVQLEWAGAFRDATINLRPAFLEAGIPIRPRHELVRQLDRLLAGHKVDLEKELLDVDLAVREILEWSADNGRPVESFEAVAAGETKSRSGVGKRGRRANSAGSPAPIVRSSSTTQQRDDEGPRAFADPVEAYRGAVNELALRIRPPLSRLLEPNPDLRQLKQDSDGITRLLQVVLDLSGSVDVEVVEMGVTCGSPRGLSCKISAASYSDLLVAMGAAFVREVDPLVGRLHVPPEEVEDVVRKWELRLRMTPCEPRFWRRDENAYHEEDLVLRGKGVSNPEGFWKELFRRVDEELREKTSVRQADGAAGEVPDGGEGQGATPAGEGVLALLHKTRTYGLSFLYHLHARIISLCDRASAYLRSGLSEEQLVPEREEIICFARDVAELARTFLSTYPRVYGTLVSVARVDPGGKMAHEEIFDMARGFLERFEKRVSRDLSEDQFVALASDLSTTLYRESDANRLWRGVEREYALACSENGGCPQPMPNPDLPKQNQIETLMASFLEEVSEDSLPWGTQLARGLRGPPEGGCGTGPSALEDSRRRPDPGVEPAEDLRVGYHDVLNGREDLGLPRTPKTTYRRWCKDPAAASDLGVNPNGKVSAQRPLVEGLKRLHAQKSPARRPPQQRGA